MKIRLVSDLHLDINRKYNVELPNNYVYTLIAGDLGGDYRKNAEWIKTNVHEGAFISGNHDAYTKDKVPIDDVKEFYHKNFPLDGPVTYLDDDVGVISKLIDDNTLLVADVLYTDYKYKVDSYMAKLPSNKRIERNMRAAEPKFSGSYMNDFMFFTRKGTYEKSDTWNLYDTCPKDLFYIRAKNYKMHFDRAFKNITKVIEENQDKNVILMTHHCLSPKCISEYFSHNSLNASYISDKTNWIKKHSNIKLIFSGHVHYRADFMVGKNTRYILNPLGYLRDGQNKQYNFNKEEQELWTPDYFIDTETWEVSQIPYNNERWEELQKESMAYSMAFI